VKKSNKKKVNIFLKNILIENKDFFSFHKQNSTTENLVHLLYIEDELWASIHIENYFSILLSSNKHFSSSFVPFILIPVKLNNILINSEEDRIVYNEYNSFPLIHEVHNDIFFFKNNLVDEGFDEDLLLIDNSREVIFSFNNEDIKTIISELKTLKKLDIFNIFNISELKEFISEELKKFFFNKENFFFCSSLIEDSFVLLKKNTFKKYFLNNKGFSFQFQDNNILLNTNKDL